MDFVSPLVETTNPRTLVHPPLSLYEESQVKRRRIFVENKSFPEGSYRNVIQKKTGSENRVVSFCHVYLQRTHLGPSSRPKDYEGNWKCHTQEIKSDSQVPDCRLV